MGSRCLGRIGRSVGRSNSRRRHQPVAVPGPDAGPLGGRTSSEIIAGLVPGTPLAKARDRRRRPSSSVRIRFFRRPTRIFVPGDNAPAKQAIIDLFNTADFYPIDLSDLVSGGRMQQWQPR
jgi:8-hydroxy-5-deazaflavin:NADPH oxidoreductase